MGYYLFHLGPDDLASDPCVLAALGPDNRMAEWRGRDLGTLFAAFRAEAGAHTLKHSSCGVRRQRAAPV